MTRIGRAVVAPRQSQKLEMAEAVPPPPPKVDADRFEAAGAPARPPGGKLLWTDAAVEVQRERGREQGGLQEARAEVHRELAVRIGADMPIGVQELAALAHVTGVSLERMDAAQLGAAAAYVGRAKSLEDRQARIEKALDNLAVLDTIGPPKLQEREFVELMWDAARIPGHAIDHLPADRQAKAYQSIAGALDTPGQHQLQVEKYDVKLSVAADGAVKDSSTKKPSKWKLVGKIALNVGLGVAAAFTGGAALVAVKAVQLGMSAYNGIKSAMKGDWLGAIGGFAGAFGGAAGATTGATSTATRIANGVTQSANAAQSAVAAVKGRSVAGLLGAAAEGFAGASSFAPSNAALVRAATVTGRTAQGAAAVEALTVPDEIKRPRTG